MLVIASSSTSFTNCHSPATAWLRGGSYRSSRRFKAVIPLTLLSTQIPSPGRRTRCGRIYRYDQRYRQGRTMVLELGLRPVDSRFLHDEFSLCDSEGRNNDCLQVPGAWP